MGNHEGPPKAAGSKEAVEQEEIRFVDSSDRFFRERARQIYEYLAEEAKEGKEKDILLAEAKNRSDLASQEINKFNHTKAFREAASKDPAQLQDALTLLMEEMEKGIYYHQHGRENFDPDMIPETDQRFADARQVFMGLGKRVFRDVPVNMRTEVLLRDALRRGSGFDHPVLNSWHDYLDKDFKVAEALALRDSDPEGLLKKIEQNIHAAGIAVNVARHTASSEEDMEAIVQTAKAVYALESMRADLEKRVAEKKQTAPQSSTSAPSSTTQYPFFPSAQPGQKLENSQARATAPTPTPTTETQPVKVEREEDIVRHVEGRKLDFQGEPFTRLMNAKTIEECRSAATPEVIEAALARALFDVDAAISHAEEFVSRNPGSILNKKTVALAFGIGVQTNEGVIYQKIGAAKFNTVPNMNATAAMPLIEFMQKFFDYDLAKDPERAEKLRRYTNVFM